MSKRKHIQAICHGPIAFGQNYKSPWEDVWLRWKGKPGRKRYYLGPTLCCHAELVADLQMDEELQVKHPDCDWSEDIARHRASLALLEHDEFSFDADGKCPDIYTKAKGINRREAERMLAFMLERRFGIRNPKFDWRKQTSFCVTPTGFGNYD